MNVNIGNDTPQNSLTVPAGAQSTRMQTSTQVLCRDSSFALSFQLQGCLRQFKAELELGMLSESKKCCCRQNLHCLACVLLLSIDLAVGYDCM
jgi:hypothetical protein